MNTNMKKRFAALALTGVVGMGITFGATSANLSKTLSDAPDMHTITYDGLAWDFEKTGQSAMNVDVTPSDVRTNKLATVTVRNIGSLPAHAAFYVDPASITELDLDNTIFDEALLTVAAFNPTGTDYVAFNEGSGDIAKLPLRDLFTQTFMSDHVLEPGQSMFFEMYIMNPYFPGSTDTNGVPLEGLYGETAFDFEALLDSDAFVQTFGTKQIFNQVLNGTSPMLEYAKAHGDAREYNKGYDAEGAIGGWSFPTADFIAANPL